MPLNRAVNRAALLLAVGVGILLAHTPASSLERPQSDPGPYPLLAVPPGWVYIQGEMYEMLEGAYRDCDSGALVEMTISGPVGTRPWSIAAARKPGAVVKRGDKEATPYELVTMREECAGKEAAATYSCERLTVSYIPDKTSSWNFSSLVRGDRQKQRVLDLVFDRARLIKFIPQRPLAISRLSVVTQVDFDSLPLGAAWDDVRTRLGPNPFGTLGDSGLAGARDGFRVFLNIEGSPKTVALRFNQQCRLQDKRELPIRRRGRK